MIAIVTDSSVGYSTAEIADRGIVSVVPLNYNVGGNNFEEKASDKNGAFMPAIESAPCKTARRSSSLRFRVTGPPHFFDTRFGPVFLLSPVGGGTPGPR